VGLEEVEEPEPVEEDAAEGVQVPQSTPEADQAQDPEAEEGEGQYAEAEEGEMEGVEEEAEVGGSQEPVAEPEQQQGDKLPPPLPPSLSGLETLQ
jgi:hypothetical protein